MRNWRIIASGVAGVVGLAVFAVSYPSAMQTAVPAIGEDYAALHPRAVGAAKAVMGVDLSTEKWLPKSELRASLFLWQQQYGRDPFDFFLTSRTTDLVYANVAGKDITVTFNADGRVVGVRSTRKRRTRRASESKEPLLEDRDARARQAFRYVTGEFAGRFPSEPEIVNESEYRWSAASPSGHGMRWQVSVRTDGLGLRDVVVRPVQDDSLRNRYRGLLTGMGEGNRVLSGTLMVFAFIVLGAMTIFSLMRKTVDWRSALCAAVITVGPGMLVGVGVVPGMKYATAMSTGAAVSTGLMMFCAIAVGQKAAREMEWEKWKSLRILLSWKWHGKAVGAALRNGILWSPLLAAVPPLVQMSGWFPGMHLGTYLADPGPAGRWAAILSPLDVTAGLFGTLLALLSQRFPVRFLALALFVPLGAVFLFLQMPVVSHSEGALTAAVIITVLGLVIYLAFDLLTVLFAMKGYALAWTAGEIWRSGQPAGEVTYWLIGVWAAMWVVGAVIAARGVEVEPRDAVASRFLSAREKLKAEFSTAQRAQQQMLPQTAPYIPGFAVVAMCQPARDVGGDLYDYFPLAGGKRGFCVADVSGKGLPAALYMTLTKGLIAAASMEKGDLRELVGKVNRHLHTACKRKMFVTAAVASLDPETREVELVRAGHNAPLLFEAATGAARYWKPAGIGLGLSGPNLFDRGTKSETVVLAPGDVLVLYSDGVTEAMNENLEQYGEQRLQEVVEKHGRAAAGVLLAELKADLARFTGAEPAHDDVTLMVLQAKAAS